MELTLELASPDQLRPDRRTTPFDATLATIVADTSKHNRPLVIAKFRRDTEKAGAMLARRRLQTLHGDKAGVDGWTFRLGGSTETFIGDDGQPNGVVHYDLLIAEYTPGEISFEAKSNWERAQAEEREKQRVRRAEKAARDAAEGVTPKRSRRKAEVES